MKLSENIRRGTALAVIWCTLAFFALEASIEGLTYILGDPRYFDALFRDKYVAHLWLIRVHAVSAVAALLLGLPAFHPATRKLFGGTFHRGLGKMYGVSVLLAGVTALPMSAMAEGGTVARLGFLVLALAWLGTILWAWRLAYQRRFVDHRRAMIRNYALTYSAVISRLLLDGFQKGGHFFSDIYPLVAWSWLMGLAAAEYWIAYTRRRPEYLSVF